MKFQSGVVQPNTHSFHVHQASLDVRMTLQCTDIPSKPERVFAKFTKVSAVTVKISTLGNGCDRIFYTVRQIAASDI